MKLLKDQNGASAVEFAIVLPLLMTILFGIIEFSILLYNKQVITNASREGARAGIVSAPVALSDPEITGIINNYISGKLITFGSSVASPPDIDRVDVDGNGNVSDFGDNLIVTVDYDYTFLFIPKLVTNLTGLTAGGVKTITAVTVMRMEGSGAPPP